MMEDFWYDETEMAFVDVYDNNNCDKNCNNNTNSDNIKHLSI